MRKEIILEALSKLGDEQAVETLIAALDENNHWIQQASAKSLGEIGDLRAVGALLRLLQNINENVQYVAAISLCILKDKESFKTLSDFYYRISKRKPYSDLRKAAIDIIEQTLARIE